MVPARTHRSLPHVYLLVALLCSAAGSVDTLGYIRLGKVFVANLTGNTVLFAYSAVQRQWAETGVRLGIILAFFFGVISNRLLQRSMRADRIRLNPAIVSLLIELSVLCVLASLSIHGTLRTVLLLTLAWTLGLQNDAFQKIGPVSVQTAFLTGDIEKLGSIIASPVAGIDKKKQRRLQMGALATAWLAYAAGAVSGAIGSHLFALRALLFPAALVAAVVLLELFGPRRSSAA
jgi:uncharacterized membrane protein YoaK (UPF0700 family)